MNETVSSDYCHRRGTMHTMPAEVAINEAITWIDTSRHAADVLCKLFRLELRNFVK